MKAFLPNKISNRGFSMIQLMISVGIFGVLAAGIGLWLLRSTATTAFDTERARMEEVVRGIRVQVEKDFSGTILTTGPSGRAGGPNLHGVERYPNAARANATDNDEIVVRLERDAHIAAPINFEVVSGKLHAVICRPQELVLHPTWSCLGNADTARFDYFKTAVEKLDTFSITSAIQKDIVQRKGSAVVETDKISFEMRGYVGANIADFSFAPGQIRAMESVRYYVNPENVLLRAVRLRGDLRDGLTESTEALADRVLKLQVNYDFSRGREFGAYWPASQPAISAPNDLLAYEIPQNATGVSWRHLTRSAWSIVMASEFKPRLAAGLPTNDEEEWYLGSNGNLHYRVQAFTVIPGLTQSTRASQTGAAFCPLVAGNANSPAVAARCKPECNEIFNSPNRNDARWEGYKSTSGSDYCACAFNPAADAFDYPGENAAAQDQVERWVDDLGSLRPQDPANNQRVDACGRHYGCGWVISKHPAYFGGCFNRCLSGTDPDYPNQPLVGTNNGPLPDKVGRILELLRRGFDNATDEANFFRSCRMGTTCDSLHEWIPSIPADNFERSCQCAASNRDHNGAAPEWWQEIAEFGARDWGAICNLGWIPGNTGVARRCENTMADAQDPMNPTRVQYILRADAPGRRMGLTQEQMVMCNCLRAWPLELQRRHFQPVDRRAAHPNEVFSAGPFLETSGSWDMRAQNDAPDTDDDREAQRAAMVAAATAALPQAGEDGSLVDMNALLFNKAFSNREQMVADITFRNGTDPVVTETGGNGRGFACNQAYTDLQLEMSTQNTHFGCCVSSDARCHNSGATATVLPAFSTYAPYCNSRCRTEPWRGTGATAFGPAAPQRTAELNLIRRTILGLVAGDPLPLGCGGTAPPTNDSAPAGGDNN